MDITLLKATAEQQNGRWAVSLTPRDLLECYSTTIPNGIGQVAKAWAFYLNGQRISEKRAAALLDQAFAFKPMAASVWSMG